MLDWCAWYELVIALMGGMTSHYEDEPMEVEAEAEEEVRYSVV